MKCPFCSQDSTRVVDSRPADGNTAIKRRRVCDRCQKRFTTYEKVEVIPLVVVKKDFTRQPYERRKIEDGLFRSCHKRPISVDEIHRMVDEVETEVFHQERREIASAEIGEILMRKLKALDQVAYIRFASVYRAFDMESFMEELKTLMDEKP